MGGIQYNQLNGTTGATVGAGLQGISNMFDPYSRRWYIGWYLNTNASGVKMYTEGGGDVDPVSGFADWPQPDHAGSITVVP
jgi:hypothetical protein